MIYVQVERLRCLFWEKYPLFRYITALILLSQGGMVLYAILLANIFNTIEREPIRALCSLYPDGINMGTPKGIIEFEEFYTGDILASVLVIFFH